jgi:hypothetical protein
MKKLMSCLLLGVALLLGSAVQAQSSPQNIVNLATNIPVTNSNYCLRVVPGFGIQYVQQVGSCGFAPSLLFGSVSYSTFTVTVDTIPSGLTLQVILVDVTPSTSFSAATCFLTATSNSCVASISTAPSVGDYYELTFNLPIPQNSSGATMTAATAVWSVQ